MSDSDKLLADLWPAFFPKEKFVGTNRQVVVIDAFSKCLRSNFRYLMKDVIDSIINKHSILINIQYLCRVSNFPDCLELLYTQPVDMIGCIGCAASILLSHRLSVFNNGKLYPIAIHARLITTSINTTYRMGPGTTDVLSTPTSIPLTPFVDVKSNAVGKLVCIIGYVMRMTKIQPLVEYGSFKCSKCGKQTLVYFEDGIYSSTDRCATPNCGGRGLVLDRQSSRTIDSRYVKLQEIENFSGSAHGPQQNWDISAPRGVPRTLEIEIREDLVNYSCMAGDIIQIIGVVRSIQDRSPYIQKQPQSSGGGGGRWGGRGRGAGAGGGGGGGARAESGMYALTILANSMTTLGSVPSSHVVHVPNYITTSRRLKRSRGVMEPSSSMLVDGSVTYEVDSDADKDDMDTHQLSRHKATGNYILDQNFELNAGDRSEVIGDAWQERQGQGRFMTTGTIGEAGTEKSGIDLTTNAFETDDMSSYVDVSNGSNHLALFTPKELTAIREIGTLPGATLLPLLLNSLCPTIYGNEAVKLGLLLGLLGGTRPGTDASEDTSDRDRDGGGDSSSGNTAATSRVVSIRSDIHILLMGDPGLGKSQLLRAVEKVAPKCVLVCGNTTTTAGLTVTLCRDGNDVSMEAGALVLADQGICCIDELDKISCDVHALLECMEQQQISIAKSGMITSLPARTSVFAAANPVGGHYNRNRSIIENIKMPTSLLSRFDLIFILVDTLDSARDQKISEHIMRIHNAGKAQGQQHQLLQSSSSSAASVSLRDGRDDDTVMDGQSCLTLSQRLMRQCAQLSPSYPLLSTELLRKYIEYVRRYVHPRLTPQAAKILQKFYLVMRSEVLIGQGAIPVTTRNLESLIRLAQARSRLECREEVTEADAQDVIDLLQESLLDAFTSESGAIQQPMMDGKFRPLGSKGNALTATKMIKLLIQQMTKLASERNNNVFSYADIDSIRVSVMASVSSNAAAGVDATKKFNSTDALIDVMRTECYLILKGPKLYQLQTY